MSNTFDFAVGVNESGLNSAASQIYQSMPAFLSSSWSGSYNGASYSASWTLTAAPAFDLTPAQPASGAVFNFDVATNLTISGGLSATVPVSYTVNCSAAVNGSAASFTVTGISASAIPNDPVANAIVQNYVMPVVQSLASGFIQAVTIPPLSMDGVTLSAPAIGIVPTGNTPALVAVSNASSTTPLQPDTTLPWPASPIFAVMDQTVVQDIVNDQFAQNPSDTSFSGSGGSIKDGFGNEYNYSFSVQLPQVTLNYGTSQTVTLAVTASGTLNDTFEAFDIPTNVLILFSTDPSPVDITLAVNGNGSSVDLTVSDVTPFAIVATPQGSIGDKIIANIILSVATPIIEGMFPTINGFLNDLNGSFALPSPSVTVDGVTFTATATDLGLGNFNTSGSGTQGFSVMGNVSVTTAQAAAAKVAKAS